MVVVAGVLVVVVVSPELRESQSLGPRGVGVVPGIGAGGPTLGGGTFAPVAPFANDQPSTVPGGGVRFPAPKLLEHQLPPREATQYDQYAFGGDELTHGSSAGSPAILHRNPGTRTAF